MALDALLTHYRLALRHPCRTACRSLISAATLSDRGGSFLAVSPPDRPEALSQPHRGMPQGWLRPHDRTIGSAARLGDHAGGCKPRRVNRASVHEPAANYRSCVPRDYG